MFNYQLSGGGKGPDVLCLSISGAINTVVIVDFKLQLALGRNYRRDRGATASPHPFPSCELPLGWQCVCFISGAWDSSPAETQSKAVMCRGD